MLNITIDVNGTVIKKHFAIRTEGGTDPDDMNTYKTDTGDMFIHRYGDGAIRCAINTLEMALQREEAKKTKRKFISLSKEKDDDEDENTRI